MFVFFFYLFIGLFFFTIDLWSSLYILDKSTFSDIFVNIFSQSVACLYGIFWWQKFLILMKFSLPVFFILRYCFLCLRNVSFFQVAKLFSMFSSINSEILDFMSGSVIHLKLIFFMAWSRGLIFLYYMRISSSSTIDPFPIKLL